MRGDVTAGLRGGGCGGCRAAGAAGHDAQQGVAGARDRPHQRDHLRGLRRRRALRRQGQSVRGSGSRV
eukprot:3275139-Rhodomonas_salina.1